MTDIKSMIVKTTYNHGTLDDLYLSFYHRLRQIANISPTNLKYAIMIRTNDIGNPDNIEIAIPKTATFNVELIPDTIIDIVAIPNEDGTITRAVDYIGPHIAVSVFDKDIPGTRNVLIGKHHIEQAAKCAGLIQIDNITEQIFEKFILIEEDTDEVSEP